jgi:hypothetical protein
VALVRTVISEEHTASIRVTTFGELRTLAVTSTLSTQRRNTTYYIIQVFLHSVIGLLTTTNVPSSLTLSNLVTETIGPSEKSGLTRATRRNITKADILQRPEIITLYSVL